MIYIAITRHDDDMLTIMQVNEGRDIQEHVDKWNTVYNPNTGAVEFRFLNITWEEIDPINIPQDRSYRDAWKLESVTGKINTDPIKKALIDAKRASQVVEV